MNIISRVCASKAGRVTLGAVAGASMLLVAAAPLAQAASLTPAQIGAITTMLTAFNVDASTIANVNTILNGGTASTGSSTPGAGAVRGHMIGFLKKGDHGRGVCLLQTLLAADPTVDASLAASDASGDCPFGPMTERALKIFQSKHGIATVGFIGPQTLAAIEAWLAANPIAEEDGDSGVGRGHRICALVPPGHLIAPGWLRKHDGVRSVVPQCQKLPPGIDRGRDDDDNDDDDGHATTTLSITDVSAQDVATTTATIKWKTNLPSKSKVYFSTDSPIDLDDADTESESSLVTSHSIDLTSLAGNTEYNYVVESEDSSGNVATSSSHSFTTTE